VGFAANGGPTNQPAHGGRAPRPQGTAVGRMAKERGLSRSGGKGRAAGREGPFP